MVNRDPFSCVLSVEVLSPSLFSGVGGAENIGEGEENSDEDTDPLEGGPGIQRW